MRCREHIGLLRHIYLDYRRCRATDDTFFATLFLSQGFWAVCIYRISRWLIQITPTAILRRWMRALLALVQKVVEIITGISIPLECDIGPGLYIGHYGNIFVPPRGQLGANCNLSQHVTLGLAGKGTHRGEPIVGNRVYICAGAIAIGRITIGNDAVVGPGAVVTRSVPPRAVVMGNPARVVSYEGSFDHIRYDGMEDDPDRQASLRLVPVAANLSATPTSSQNSQSPT